MDEFVLAQLAREPVPGQVKTRLIPHLSAQRAASLHEAMVEHIVERLLPLGSLQLWVAGDPAADLFKRCLRSPGVSLHRQIDGDLGVRMRHIVEQGLTVARKVVLVGSDVPALDAAYVGAAIAALDGADAVLGPAADGGYVLLGLTQPCDSVFRDMPWGEDTVLDRTVAGLAREGLDCVLLDTLADIDRPEDLQHLPEALDW